MISRLGKLLASKRIVHSARKMAAESRVVSKGKEAFSADPATLTPEEKKDLITRNLQVLVY